MGGGNLFKKKKKHLGVIPSDVERRAFVPVRWKSDYVWDGLYSFPWTLSFSV